MAFDANIIQSKSTAPASDRPGSTSTPVGLPDAASAKSGPRPAASKTRHEISSHPLTNKPRSRRYKKEGSGFDLPMASHRRRYGGLTRKEIDDCLFVGELSLDGGVRGIRAHSRLRRSPHSQDFRLVVPEANARAAMFRRRRVYPCASLST